jgi:hypothetical protein
MHNISCVTLSQHLNIRVLIVFYSFQLRQWTGVYGDNERIAFNIPSWNTTTYVPCSDFDCDCEFFITLCSELCILYGFLLQLTVKCVVLLIVVLIVIFLLWFVIVVSFGLWYRKWRTVFRVLIIYCVLWYPNWGFFRVFPSVVRQMPGNNSSKTGHGPHL